MSKLLIIDPRSTPGDECYRHLQQYRSNRARSCRITNTHVPGRYQVNPLVYLRIKDIHTNVDRFQHLCAGHGRFQNHIGRTKGHFARE